MFVQKRKPLAGFEEDYDKFVKRKELVEEQVKQEFELEIAKRTETLEKLIEIVTEIVDVEIVENETSCEELANEVDEYGNPVNA